MLKAVLPVIRSGYQSVLHVKEPIFTQPTRVSKITSYGNVIAGKMLTSTLSTEYIHPETALAG